LVYVARLAGDRQEYPFGGLIDSLKNPTFDYACLPAGEHGLNVAEKTHAKLGIDFRNHAAGSIVTGDLGDIRPVQADSKIQMVIDSAVNAEISDPGMQALSSEA